MEVFGEADRQGVKDALSRSAAAADSSDRMVKICFPLGLCPKDSPHEVSYGCTLLKHNDGFVDIASRQGGNPNSKLSSEEAELKDSFNEAPIALHWLCANGKVLWVNDRELEMLGYSREEYVGAEMTSFCPDSADDILEIFKLLGTGSTIRDVPVRFRTKAGKVQDVLVDFLVKYKSDGSFNHTRCFIREDTRLIIRESRAEMMVTASKKIAVEKERFSSKLFHAVKTPIHAIALAISDPNSIDVPVVVAQMRELAGLITTVSKALKFDDGYVVKPLPAAVNLSSLVRGYREVAGVRHEVVVEEIGFDTSLVVLADVSMLRTVLDELVWNAEERSPSGALIRLSVERRMSRGQQPWEGGGGEGEDDGETNSFEFRVVDIGQKLDEARVEKVFRSYRFGDDDVVEDNREEDEDSGDSSAPAGQRKRVLSIEEEAVGTNHLVVSEETPGLRLNVAFNYVQCLDSVLRVDSDSSRTAFEFTLVLKLSFLQEERTPTNEDHSATAIYCSRLKNKLPSATNPVKALFRNHHPGGGTNDSNFKHVLIAEDNTVCQKLCLRIITNLGHTADTADNGAIAVEMVTRDINIYDIVLMDLRMPVMDGVTAAKKIHEKIPDLPIVAFSAEEGQSTREAARNHMVAFMDKPASAGRLMETIQEHARRPLLVRLSVGITYSCSMEGLCSLQ